MNQRIQQLADKIWEEKYWTNPNTDKLLPAQLNRFAELIVRECAEFARQHNLEKADRSHMIHKAIKEHFGVEE